MKMIFLVDGDNNIGTGLQGIDLLTEEDTVLVFFGKGQTLANVKKLCAGTKAQVQYLESVKGGKNSLDFQIITELGVLVGRGEADFAYVISQDKGYEAAMSALHARYASTFREVALRPSIQDCLQAAFLLRALGYTDSGASPDFTWSTALDRAVELGVLTSAERTALNSGSFLRAQVVYLSYFALSAPLKDGSGILLDKTAASSGVDKSQLQAVMDGVAVSRLS